MQRLFTLAMMERMAGRRPMESGGGGIRRGVLERAETTTWGGMEPRE